MGDMMGQMSTMMGGGTGAWAAWMALALLLVAAALMTLSVLAVRAVRAAGQRRTALANRPTAEDDALRTLRQRYARSEIDEEEFFQRQSALATC